MFAPFKLKKTIGRDYTVDLNDSLKTKKALNALGYYEKPKHGVTPYPDHQLIKGIEAFQADHSLRQDGVMKPGGETETVLNHLLLRRNLPTDHSAIDSGRLFELFDRFSAPDFHAGGSAESTKCCATGTCINS